jgi:hypothetical protein
MTRAAPAASPEPQVNDWKRTLKSIHETPSLLSFTNKEKEKPNPENLSELLTKKFREFFP